MSTNLPTVTIIIPARPGESRILALEEVRALDYPRERIDVIVARGRQPSVQRNTALKVATGELIYFLDDDARPVPGALRRAADHFRRPDVQMVGGPNICPSDAPSIEHVFAVVLSSWLAFGPSRARYAPIGEARESSEKELILCNLIARRQTLVELGGFDESLYPNEENALMDDLQKRGGKLLYDPQVIVERRPRPTLKAFTRMLVTYGRGRAEQFRLHPTFGSALNFVPPLFCVYLVALLFFAVFAVRRGHTDWLAVASIPLVLYFVCVLTQTLVSALHHGFARSLAAMPLIIASHIFYGLGFWRGLFTRLRKGGAPRVDVALEYVKL
jgi:cellulose synthase/poly-beta-1,6-N-acetylglucosamine synthase-like glycosyltransferase